GGIADQQPENDGGQQSAERERYADTEEVAQKASPVRSRFRRVFPHGEAREPEVADGRDDRDESRDRQEVTRVDHAEVADHDCAGDNCRQCAEPVAAETQHAPADHAGAGGTGIEDVHVYVLRRAGQRRIAVGWERRYHPCRGYWTVGVPLPRENCRGGAIRDRPTLSTMHIALVHHHVGGKAGGGGGVRLMLELGTGLVRRGHRVTVACHDFLPGSEFAYASDRLEIRSVRRGISELPVGNRALARRVWLDMPKVARLVPPDADV